MFKKLKRQNFTKKNTITIMVSLNLRYKKKQQLILLIIFFYYYLYKFYDE